MSAPRLTPPASTPDREARSGTRPRQQKPSPKFRDLGVGRKIGLTFGALIAVYVVLFAAVWILASGIDHRVREIVDEVLPASNAAYEMEINVNGQAWAVADYLQKPNLAAANRFAKDQGDFLRFHRRFVAADSSPDHAAMAATILARYDRYHDAGDELIALKDREPAIFDSAVLSLRQLDILIDADDRRELSTTQVGALEIQKSISQIRSALAKSFLSLVGSVGAIEAGARNDVQDEIEHLRSRIGLLGTYSLPPAQRAWLGEVAVLLEEISAQILSIVSTMDEIETRFAEFIGLRDRMDDLLDESVQIDTARRFDDAIRSVNGAVFQTKVALAFAGGLIVLLSIGAMLYFMRALVRRIRTLTADVRQFSDGNLAHPVSVTGDDEIGTLARQFKGMATELGIFLDRLAGSNDSLRDEVERRTADLADANRSLAGELERRKQIEQELIASNIQARASEQKFRESQKMEAIGQLTGDIAHDFNNHLSVIMGNLEMLKDRVAADPDARRHIESAILGASRGAELTQSLLAFARRQPLSPRICDVGTCIAESVQLVGRSIGEDIEVRLNREPESWTALVDEAQLGACIVNLANNARDAMPKGGTLTISVRNVALGEDDAARHPEVKAGSYVVIEVSDTGTGMTPEALARAFEPFFTTKEVGKGTGLGLSMVHGFVKQSGGHVEIDSAVGRSTSVRIYLPRVAERRAAPAAVPAETARSLGGSETVLVVEDNEGVRKTVAAQLTGLGYRVLEAADGEAALAILDRPGQAIDLLFTDIVMPGKVDGYALAEAAADRWPGLKVLLTSGFPGRRLDAGGEGPSDLHLLSKPYRQDDLARAIRTALHPD